jgi:hypothetical protein
MNGEPKDNRRGGFISRRRFVQSAIHFAAHEQPELFVAELRKSFAQLS